MERFARLVLRHRRIVVALWLVLFLAGGVAAGRLSDRLSFDFSLPGQPGDTAEKSLVRDFGVSSSDTLVPTLTMPEGEKVADHRDDVRRIFSAVRTQVGAQVPVRVVDYVSTGDDRLRLRRRHGHLRAGAGAGALGLRARSGDPAAPVLEKAAAPSGIAVSLTSYELLRPAGTPRVRACWPRR